ncbi:hypothetical protein PR003_g24033 [Phytophthora rubi]|uniref:Uncharacterized protein n=1 Tax=Phytophthora rubi TaxID=129364 RepID=A0A6A3INI5_9STRA|nr:hypothetical protein PR002_g25465 [Phytophthora rubi]KAE8981684.1 hypothetical protein PR001_g23927 [Phytophthora rubi]KAE9295362.1 hypothetical protein PR003_g24033 [Phytophthora rubi]
MCRVTATIEPPGVFFGPSTATLEDFQYLPSPVALPLRSSYTSFETQLTKKPSTLPSQPKRSAIQTGVLFVPGTNGVRFQDEEFAREVKSRVAQLVAAAAAADASSTNTQLARRVIKYRNISQPALDATDTLSVH